MVLKLSSNVSQRISSTSLQWVAAQFFYINGYLFLALLSLALGLLHSYLRPMGLVYSTKYR